MKKKICIIVALLLLVSTVPMITLGQNANPMQVKTKNKIEELTYQYHFNEPTFEEISVYGVSFIQPLIENCELYGNYEEPKLPVKPLKLLLPQETTLDQIVIETSEPVFVDYVENIMLGEKAFALDQEIPIDIPTPNYDTSTEYPGFLYETLGIQYYRGFPILHVNLFPVQYHGDSKILTYYPTITLKVETKPNEINPLYRGLDKDIKKVSNKIDNYDIRVLSSFETQTIKTNDERAWYDYVIITTNAFKNYNGPNDFNDLVNHRISDGLSAGFKTTEEIYSEYSGSDNAEKIRNYIIDAYDNGLEWVLLGGDYEFVPFRYLYAYDGGDGNLAADTYFGCLDGNYNYDGDSYYGEKNDGIGGGWIDLYYDVSVGRAPVDNQDQIDNFVRKTIGYENTDFGSDSHLDEIVQVGEYVWSGAGGWGGGYIERCVDHCTDYGQDTHGIPSDVYTITELFERDMSWDDDDLINEINAGFNFMNHLGHASPTSCSKLTPSEIEDLTNTDFESLWYSQGCHSGQWQAADECMSEAWVVYDHGGCSSIMNSGYGYGSRSDYDGPSNRYAREFFDALYNVDEVISQVGPANDESREDNIWHVNESSKYMYHCYYSVNVMGCPYTEIKGAEDFGANFYWLEDYPNPGDTIHFQDDSVGANSYSWDFDDGGTSSQKNPTHVFTEEGYYDVTLVIFGGGESDSCTKTVELWDNWRPEAIASPEFYAGNEPQVLFDGSDSWDPDGTVVSYLWDFDDGTTSTEMSPSHTYSEDGEYDVTLTVTDNNGKDSYPFHCEIYIDAYTPPETECLIKGSVGNNGWIKGPVSIVLKASDWSGVDYSKFRVDGGIWITFIDPFAVVSPGEHSVDYYSVDIWGNVEDVKTTTFKIDSESPTLDVEIEGEKIEDWYVSDVTFTCTGSDFVSGVKWIRYQIVDQMEEWATYTEPFVVSGDGNHIIRIYVEDIAGNIEGKTIPYIIGIDQGPPVTTCELDGNRQQDGWYQGEVTASLIAEDTVSGVNSTYYKLDGDSEYQKYESSFIVAERGKHTIEYYSIDELGNEETAKTTEFQIGAPPTTPTISGPDEGTPNEEYTWTISATHPEGSTLEYYVEWGDGEIENWFGPYSTGEVVEITHTYTEEKINTFRVKARDQWGGESDWGTFDFSTPKSKNQQESILIEILQYLLERFPILQKILEMPILSNILTNLNI